MSLNRARNLWERIHSRTGRCIRSICVVCSMPVGGDQLWEQSLLAINDNAICLMDCSACIASKLCSHRFVNPDPQRRAVPVRGSLHRPRCG